MATTDGRSGPRVRPLTLSIDGVPVVPDAAPDDFPDDLRFEITGTWHGINDLISILPDGVYPLETPEGRSTVAIRGGEIVPKTGGVGDA